MREIIIFIDLFLSIYIRKNIIRNVPSDFYNFKLQSWENLKNWFAFNFQSTKIYHVSLQTY